MLLRFTRSIGVVLLAACATRAPEAGLDAGTPRWTGTLQQTTERTGTLAPVGQQRATGTIVLAQTAADSTRMRVRLTVSAPGDPSTTLRWAVLPGRCGSSALPLIGVEQFPTIDIGSNERGEITADIPLRLDGAGTYHVNVYRGTGTQLSDVLTCGNLRRSS